VKRENESPADTKSKHRRKERKKEGRKEGRGFGMKEEGGRPRMDQGGKERPSRAGKGCFFNSLSVYSVHPGGILLSAASIELIGQS
jgi:hypothetical protein